MPFVPRPQPVRAIFGVAVTPVRVALMAMGCILAPMILMAPLAFYLDWREGRSLSDLELDDFQWVAVFATAVGILFLAGLARAVVNRREDGGCEWTYEKDRRCEERAESFVRHLLRGDRQAAYAQLAAATKERLPFREFDREWKSLESRSGAKNAKFETIESAVDDSRRGSRHARLCSAAGVPFSIATVRFRYRESGEEVYGDVGVDQALVLDEWVVLSWEGDEGADG